MALIHHRRGEIINARRSYENALISTLNALSTDDIYSYGKRAAKGGFSLAVHAIGDQANRETLNGFARIRQYEHENNLPALRHRVEHVQTIHPDDAGRLAELGLVASMQPIHALSDMQMADRLWGERASFAYACANSSLHLSSS
jgi:predicted amidohydrolase YtcJ